jgi:hypothetical protein
MSCVKRAAKQSSTVRRFIPSALLLVLLSTIPTQVVHAQSFRNLASHQVRLTVTEAAVIALNDPSPLELSAGKADGSRRLSYTIINKDGATRAILVQWATGDAAPAGTSLRIAASVPEDCGLAVPEVTVGSVPQSLIAGVPSCTTDIAGRGAVLRYRLVVDDKSQADSGFEYKALVIFTLLDQ